MEELKKFDPLEVKEIVQQIKTLKHIITVKSPKNNIFEFCPKSLTMVEAEIQNDTVGQKPRLMTKEGKIYINALNQENAFKKLLARRFWFHTLTQ